MFKIVKKAKRKLYIALNPYRYKHCLKKKKYIAHALGGIKEHSYTNSKEALIQSYENGFRLFEADIRLASDDILILAHGGWQKRMGFDENSEMVDSSTFLTSKIHEEYTPMSFKDLAEFMKSHKDMYVMLDIGKKNAKITKKIYNKIFKDSKKDTSVLQRLIVGGHNPEMVAAIKEVYDFKLFNLYCPCEEKRPEEINTSDKIITYCKKQKIQSISIPVKDYNQEVIDLAHKNNMLVYLFTVNEKEEAEKHLQTVDVIGTDFIK